MKQAPVVTVDADPSSNCPSITISAYAHGSLLVKILNEFVNSTLYVSHLDYACLDGFACYMIKLAKTESIDALDENDRERLRCKLVNVLDTPESQHDGLPSLRPEDGANCYKSDLYRAMDVGTKVLLDQVINFEAVPMASTKGYSVLTLMGPPGPELIHSLMVFLSYNHGLDICALKVDTNYGLTALAVCIQQRSSNGTKGRVREAELKTLCQEVHRTLLFPHAVRVAWDDPNWVPTLVQQSADRKCGAWVRTLAEELVWHLDEMFTLSAQGQPSSGGSGSGSGSAPGSRGGARIARDGSAREFQPSSSSPLNPHARRANSGEDSEIGKADGGEKVGLASRFKSLFTRKNSASRPGSRGSSSGVDKQSPRTQTLPEINTKRRGSGSGAPLKSSSFCVASENQRFDSEGSPLFRIFRPFSSHKNAPAGSPAGTPTKTKSQEEKGAGKLVSRTDSCPDVRVLEGAPSMATPPGHAPPSLSGTRRKEIPHNDERSLFTKGNLKTTGNVDNLDELIDGKESKGAAARLKDDEGASRVGRSNSAKDVLSSAAKASPKMERGAIGRSDSFAAPRPQVAASRDRVKSLLSKQPTNKKAEHHAWDYMPWTFEATREQQYTRHYKLEPSEFEVTHVIGRGMTSMVYLAELKRAAQLAPGAAARCVLKVMRKDTMLSDNRRIGDLAAQEGLMVAQMQECNFIMRMFGSFETEEYFFMCCEWAPCDFFQLMTDFFGTYRYFCNVKLYAAQVLLSLEHVHTLGYVYRDLKPENLLVRADGSVLLSDMGLATKIPEHKPLYAVCGTSVYMPPEMVTKYEGYNHMADLWCFGIFLYEMVTCITPFESKDRDKKKLFAAIRNVSKVNFPSDCKADDGCKSLIRALLLRQPSDRLGAQDKLGCYNSIKAHDWFADLDWDAVTSKSITPSIAPIVRPDDFKPVKHPLQWETRPAEAAKSPRTASKA
uniref:Protein kinase domain-containing protein n=1 Tax=Pyramimonas obovata TaxID=1411642 RepID=A0A7S0WWH3_9CHLO|mmetsp:Transcript_6206/g.12642  ORF Transcript_6206/g.12642 Transcript_6206/m.12642 type:complete len:949 (+) Transcript_6206:184-3030(+)